MDKIRAIVVDDEPSILEAIKAILETEEIETFTTMSSLTALEKIKTEPFDIVISDLKMPEIDGMELFKRTREFSPETIFIIITAYATVQAAVNAIKEGVYDYIPKPFTPDEVRIPIRRALERKRLEQENINLRTQVESRFSFQNIIGNSEKMHEIFRIMRHAASSDSNVLIIGESGTGKELVARAIHSNSIRAKRKFVVVNCGAIPEGLMESEFFGHVKGAFTGAVSEKRGMVDEADKGTLFLDEIGELPLIMQVKLLRVLQDGDFQRVGDVQPRKVNVRIIAATNRNLAQAIAEKSFREDLYYRLNVIPINMPPLRTRKEDIPMLVNHFIQKHKGKSVSKSVDSISREAMQVLLNYNYPGNVRELENIIEYAMAFASGNTIEVHDLPKYIEEAKKMSEETQKIPLMPLREAKIQFERGIIMSALVSSKGNISEAARILNIHRQNLQQKIKLLGIDLSNITITEAEQ